jgi:hypothetical protein
MRCPRTSQEGALTGAVANYTSPVALSTYQRRGRQLTRSPAQERLSGPLVSAISRACARSRSYRAQ